MDLSDDKLGFCLLLKSDGNGLYATKDVLLAQEKFREFDIQKISTLLTSVKAFTLNKFLKFLKVGFEQADHAIILIMNLSKFQMGQ